MSDQSHHWSRAAEAYEQEFVDPYRRADGNPLLDALAAVPDPATKTVADLGCGLGPLLPFLAERFGTVLAVDFAPGMLERARTRCDAYTNVEFHQLDLTDLSSLRGRAHVAAAVNSLVQPRVHLIERALRQVRRTLVPGGLFLGIVPAMDAIHYQTMLLLDRARKTGMPEEKARQNAAKYAEHHLYGFAFGDFAYQGLEQHFWQPFEIPYRLRRARFVRVRKKKFPLERDQFACAADLKQYPPPWDWFFQAERPRKRG